MPTMAMVWRTHANQSTGCTPVEATHGYPMRTAAEATAPLDEGVSDPGPMKVADIAVLRRSSQLFGRFATQVKQSTRERTAARLNARGPHRSFKVGDKVKFYCGTSSAEAKKLGRKAKHLTSYRPGVVIEVDATRSKI